MVNPTTAMSDAPMSGLANLMAMKGRDNDSMLVHLSPNEVSSLNKLSGNTMTINPDTGLPEGKSRFLDAILPALASIAVGVATGGASIPIQMAAQGAVGYGSAKLQGKSDEEALTSGGLNAVTAGIFGGVGNTAAAGGTEAGKSLALQGTKETLAKQAAAQALPDAGAGAVSEITAKAIADNTAAIAANKLAETTARDVAAQTAQGTFGDFAGFLAKPNDIFGQIAADQATGKTLMEALTTPQALKGLTGMVGTKTAGNALVNQMRVDAEGRPIEEAKIAEAGELYSTPFTQTSMGPFNQQQVADNFISNSSGPYGMNFLNQSYGQEGGQVAQMNQGGLTQFNSIMGNPALQLQNPNPPMQMGFGGSIGKALGLQGGSGTMEAQPQGGPRGSSQGGKGNLFNSPEILALLKEQGADTSGSTGIDQFAGLTDNPVQQMKAGGDLGNYIPSVGIIGGLLDMLNKNKDKKDPAAITNNYYGTGPDGKPMLMDGPPQQINTGNPMQMAGGGMPDMSSVPPEMLAAIQSQISTPAVTPKSYDVLASIGNNPMQQMNQGGMTGAGQAQDSLMPALIPALQVANQQAQVATQQPLQMKGGGEIVEGLKGIARGAAFEGKVVGEGDGMSDDIPFMIEGEQPALLARDEYVIPADVVAMVGNGSSNAGAEQFDQFLANMRQLKYGRAQQPRETEGLETLI